LEIKLLTKAISILSARRRGVGPGGGESQTCKAISDQLEPIWARRSTHTDSLLKEHG